MLTRLYHRRLPATLLPLLAIALLVSACGGDSDDTKSLSLVATEPAAKRFAIEGPDSIEAGLVEVELKNEGKQDREAQLVKLEGGRTADDALKEFDRINAGRPAPDWFRARGGVGPISAGETAKVTQRLEPGSYLIFDTNEPDGENVEPHYKNGAFAELEVTGEPTDASLPETDAAITAREYSFTASGLKAGRNEVQFRNEGAQWHHLIAFPIESGSTIEDVKRFFRTERGRPPFDEEDAQSTAVMDGGEDQVVELELAAGNYALVCFIPDRQGGPPHAAKGMISEATVR